MRTLPLCLCLGLAGTALACADVNGSPPSNGLSAEPIVGGKPDTTSRNVMGILTREGELCSGSLILPNLLLTARHCVATLSSGENVQCGVSNFGAAHPATDFAVSWTDNLRNNIPDNTVFYVSDVRVPQPTGVCGNDIALLELSSNVPSDQATPITPRLDTAPANNEIFDAVGYGITNPNDQSGTTAGQRMRFDGGKVTCVGNGCTNLGGVANEWGGQVPVCSGDSGGPALDMMGQVIGATSRGPADCSFAVYTGLTAWKSFILDGATTAVTDGGYTPPAWVSGMPATDGGITLDGGMPADAGSGMSDGGIAADGGMPMRDGGVAGSSGTGMMDGGVAGSRGMTMPDGGVAGTFGMPMRDGGVAGSPGMTLTDAGVPSDAGAPPPDGGMPLRDAGAPNAGTGAGGATGDAGVKTMKDGSAGSSARPMAGAPGDLEPPAASGCGCRTVPSRGQLGLESWSLFFAALVVAARRRKPSARPDV